MPQLQDEGRFKARIFDAAVNESKNGFPQWVARFGAEHMLMRNEQGQQVWTPLDNTYEITGFFILGYVDKNTNELEATNHVENIGEAVGWDPGSGLAALDGMDLTNVWCQINVQPNDQARNGLEVAFINHVDSEGGGVRKLEGDRLRALDQKWGQKFRAKFGQGQGQQAPAAPGAPPAGGQAPPQQGPPPQSAPQQPPQQGPPAQGPAQSAMPPQQPPQQGQQQAAPPPPAAGQAPPQQGPAQPQQAPPQQQQPPAQGQQQPAMTGANDLIDLGGTQAPPPPGPQDPYQSQKGGQPTATQNDAWQAFSAARPQGMADQQFFNEWWRILFAAFGENVDMDALTAAQWAWVRDWAPGAIIPF